VQVKTVRASSVKEAMEQIKDELGSNAVLLHTKKYREGGVLGGAEMIEVTAAVDESQQRTLQPSPAYVPPASPILPTNVVNRYRMNETAGPEGGAVPQAGPVYDVYAPDVVQLPYAAPPAATLLCLCGDDLSSCLKLIGGGFKDTTRIASSNADMWADICMTNAGAITDALRELQTIMGEVITAIDAGDRQAIHDYFSASKARRDSILHDAEQKFDTN